MKICFITATYLPKVGGTEIAIYEIAKRLIKKGHDITIIVPKIIVGRHNQSNEIETHRVLHIPIPQIGGFIALPLIFREIRDLDKKKNFDLLHQFHVFYMGGACIFAKKKLNKPLVTSLMGDDTHSALNPVPKIFNPYIAWIMNNSAAVTSPSNDLVGYAKKQGLKRDAVVIPHGVDLNDFNPNKYSTDIRKNFGISDNEIMVVSLQRLHKLKGTEHLINAISIVIKKSPNVKVKFIIVGTGPQKEELENLVKKINIEDNVIFTGFIPHGEKLFLLLSSCDVFAFHSNYESFGIVLVEAMASGKPVISTNVGAIPEIVDNGKTGIIVPPRDSKALADAIFKLVEDKDLRIKMGIEGRKKAEREYDWDKIAERYEMIYESLTSL